MAAMAAMAAMTFQEDSMEMSAQSWYRYHGWGLPPRLFRKPPICWEHANLLSQTNLFSPLTILEHCHVWIFGLRSCKACNVMLFLKDNHLCACKIYIYLYSLYIYSWQSGTSWKNVTMICSGSRLSAQVQQEYDQHQNPQWFHGRFLHPWWVILSMKISCLIWCEKFMMLAIAVHGPWMILAVLRILAYHGIAKKNGSTMSKATDFGRSRSPHDFQGWQAQKETLQQPATGEFPSKIGKADRKWEKS